MQATAIEGFRLSPQQEHLWSLQQHDHQSVYCSDCVISITGNLDIQRLELALQAVVNRHEILRTYFRCLPGMTIPVQVITNSKITLEQTYNLSNLTVEEQDSKFKIIVQNLKCLPFDLENGFNLQTALITLSSDKHLLYLSLPAICSDTITLHNLMREVASAYSGDLNSELSEEPLQYADFSEWQNQILEAEETDIGRKYWLQQNLSIVDTVKLPYEINNSDKHEFEPKAINSLIDNDLVQKIENIAKKSNISSSIFLLACWQVLLWRLLEKSEIIIGVGIDGRKYDELKSALGLFAKYLPLHSHLEENLSFSKVLQQVNESVEEINKWQECFSWEQINSSATQLTYLPFGFDFQQESVIYYVRNVKFSIEQHYTCIERFKIKLSCKQQAEVLNLEFHYDSNLFNDESIELIAENFNQLIATVINNPEEVISRLNILSDRTLHQILFEFNKTETNYPKNKFIHQLFVEQVERTPDNIAIVFNNQQLTYTELNRRANQLAHYLQSLGVGAEVLVGISVERSLEMLIGILGILKAGGVYIPLDPHYPQERLAFMLEDTQVSILLTQQHLLKSLPQHNAQIICLDTDWETIAQESQENPIFTASPENLAYVIYTSGSTGQPKGVAIAHHNLVHSTTARISYYQEPVTNFLLLSSFAFDSSVAGIFWTLSCGGTLHLPAEGVQREVPKLVELIFQNRISHLLSLPSLYALILQQAKPAQLNSLCSVIVAGEACPPELLQHHSRLQLEASLFNEYGPTEATVWSSVYHCQSLATGTQISIGSPIANTQIYILDSHLHPVPVGVTGEIYISGEGLARGYLNQPAITSEKFIPHPFSQKPGMRLYKTGDLARYLNDSNIEFLGRIDNQVKIRGFRIELGEIETALNQHPEVKETVVIAREDVSGNQNLVAYIVLQPESNSRANELRSFLQEKLPDFMIPAVFVSLQALPLTANGKVDRRALPAPDQVNTWIDESYVAPRNSLEEQLAAIWAEVLRIEKVGIYNNFFALGGHSLLVTQLISRMRDILGVELFIQDVFSNPTVADFSVIVTQKLAEQVDDESLARSLAELEELSDEDIQLILTDSQ